MNTFVFVGLMLLAEVAVVALAYFIGHSVGMVEGLAQRVGLKTQNGGFNHKQSKAS